MTLYTERLTDPGLLSMVPTAHRDNHLLLIPVAGNWQQPLPGPTACLEPAGIAAVGGVCNKVLFVPPAVTPGCVVLVLRSAPPSDELSSGTTEGEVAPVGMRCPGALNKSIVSGACAS